MSRKGWDTKARQPAVCSGPTWRVCFRQDSTIHSFLFSTRLGPGRTAQQGRENQSQSQEQRFWKRGREVRQKLATGNNDWTVSFCHDTLYIHSFPQWQQPGRCCRSLLAEFLRLPNQYRIWCINPWFELEPARKLNLKKKKSILHGLFTIILLQEVIVACLFLFPKPSPSTLNPHPKQVI